MARSYFRSLFSFLLLAALILPLAGQPFAAPAHAAGAAVIDPALQAALSTATGVLPVIVTFHGQQAPAATEVGLLRAVGITQGVALRALPMAGVLATADQVRALAARPEVRSVYLNSELTLFNGEANELTGVKRVRTDSALITRNGGVPLFGRGVGVVVNDSGVDCTHPDLRCTQNVLGSTNLHAYSGLLPITYVEDVPNTDTNSGHGTHVAGTVAGSGARSGGLYEGAAPGASLIGYGSGGALLVLDGLGGFDYTLANQQRYDIRIITNSWGSSGDFDPEHPINVASYQAYKRNIVVLFAAGNEGPSDNTHNPYAKAPWVISVAAGTKQGNLVDFSSRGTAGVGGTFTVDGETWRWEDSPTITAPGVSIISTRVIAPVSGLGAPEDVELIPPAYLPYYTTMSGTSMATPHVAGIVALLLEAKPTLTPAEVRTLLTKTATNMPGLEPWEVGAGYVNAYAAVDMAYSNRGYGKTVNASRTFNSNVPLVAETTPFTVDYSPAATTYGSHSFSVAPGASELIVRVQGKGLAGETGNPINLVVIAPDGTETSSGVAVLFATTYDRVVSVPAPAAGTWRAEIRGLRNALPIGGVGLPEQVAGTVTLKRTGTATGLNDIAGHAAAAAITLAVSERLVDGYADGTFQPDRTLTRRELAHSLVMGAGVRQTLPVTNRTFPDVQPADLPFIEAVVARGAALKDRTQVNNGLLLPYTSSSFRPEGAVTRLDLAYALVQSLGLQAEAVARNNEPLTVQYGDRRIAIDDAGSIRAPLRGYVQLALDLNILNARFSLVQGPYDLQPTIHATFVPNESVSRATYATTALRFFNAYLTR